MNKINKYLSLTAVAALGAGWLASCDTSKDNDFVSEYDGAPGIFFSSTANSYLELDENQSTITYHAYRDVAGGEQTVGLTVDPMDAYDDPDIFTFPTSVTFPAGSKEADIVIGYDISRIAVGEELEYQLTLDAEPNPFSSNSIVITLTNPAPWELLGTNGQYYDYGWGVSNDSNGPVTVSVYRQGLDPNIYRISNPYVGFNEEETFFQFRVLQVGDTYLGVNVTRPDIVGFNMYYVTYDQDEQSDIYIAFPGMFQGMDDIGFWTSNRVVEYQDDGTPGLIQLAPLYFVSAEGFGYGDGATPYIEIYFPGYVSLDTTLEISYEGTLVTEGQEEYAMVEGQIGEDITEVRVAIANTESMTANQLLEAIQDGTIDYTTFNTTGNWKVPFEGMSTGQYTLMAVAYVDDTPKSMAQLSFFYVAKDSQYDPNEGWNSLGWVAYTDGYIVAAMFTGESTITYPVEIQESKETSGLYRLVNPYGTYFASFFGSSASSKDVPPTYIVIDATNPDRVKILQTEQSIEYFDGDYNLLSIWSWADMWLENGATEAEVAREDVYGTYANGHITFPPYALCMLWSDEPDQWYSANIALDYDAYLAGSQNPVYYNEDGTIYAPFDVDMNTLTTENPFVSANSVAMPFVNLSSNPTTQMLKQQPKKLPLPDKLEKNSPNAKKKAPQPLRRVR